jgi:glucosamine-6-phosphate deaminase
MSRRLVVVPEPEDVHRAFADQLLALIRASQVGDSVVRLILPIGPTAQYPLVASATNAEQLSWRNVRVVLMDEYLDWHGRPLPVTDPLSFQGQFKSFLAMIDAPLRLADEHWVIPDPFDIDRVDRFIDGIGGIDTCFGGVGVHGHVAFNEPPVSRYGRVTLEDFALSGCRVVALAPETITINALRAAGGRFEGFPTMAVTIGMRHILGAATVRLYCDGGTRQQEAIHKFAIGQAEVDWPVSLLHDHPDCVLTADSLAAARATARSTRTESR